MRRKLSTTPQKQSIPASARRNFDAPSSLKGGRPANEKNSCFFGKLFWHQTAGVVVLLASIHLVIQNGLDPDESVESMSRGLPTLNSGEAGHRDILWKPRVMTEKGHVQQPLSSESQDEGKDGDNDAKSAERIKLTEQEVSAQERILDSDEYSKRPEPMYTEECEPQYDWMTKVYPVCNMLHELDMTDIVLPKNVALSRGATDDMEKFRFVASGGYRDVYMFRDHNWDKLALKTLKTTRDFEERHYDRHRRDAIAADRLASVPTSVDIYGYCGQSAVYEFAEGGNLRDAINKHIIRVKDNPNVGWNSTKKLQVAYMVASSIADLHNVDKEGRASIVHTDISNDQFISIKGDGYFQLNDFNRARFLKRNIDDKSSNCPFFVKSNKGKFRSPEEYLYLGETEAVDTYSMGNIFFVLLTGTYPFPNLTKKEVKKAVGNGERPSFSERLLNNPDVNEQALIDAARMCWVHDPRERASAREVQLFLQSKIN